MNLKVAVASVILLTSPAYARNPNFHLWNHTDRTIIGAWLSTADDRNWHAISGDQITPDNADLITFQEPDSVPCDGVQLRVRFADGQYASFMDGFNICTISNIVVEWNNNEGEFEAVYK
jgi:hypothetical protein